MPKKPKQRNAAGRPDRTIIDTHWLSADLVRLTFRAPHKMAVGNVFPVKDFVFTVEAVPNPKMVDVRKWPEKKVEAASAPPRKPLRKRLADAKNALLGR